MDNKLEYKVVIMQAPNYKLASEFNKIKFDMNKRHSESTNMRYDMNKIKKMLTHMMSQKHHSSPYNMYSPKAQDPFTALPAYKNSPTLEVRHSTKNCGMWTLKHDKGSPELYELLIKT